MIGEKVFVYYDLHTHTWSLKSLDTGRVLNIRTLPSGKREKQRVDTVVLKDAKFKVSEAGRQRVLRERSKNVHAGVVGTVVALDAVPAHITAARPVTYNPYKYSTFVDRETGDPVHDAPYAILANGKAFTAGSTETG